MKRKILVSLAATLALVVCLFTLASCLPHEHTYASEWSSDAENHWHAADCTHTDEKSDVASHTWDDGTMTKTPTETEAGLKVYTCTVCAYAREEVIPALSAHEHSYTSSVVAPTCTEDGYTLHTCTCGDSYTDTETPALDHDFTVMGESHGDGTHSLVCSRDESHTKRVSCTYGTAVTPATCTEGGYTTYTCSCGHGYRDDETEPTGHTYAETWSTDGYYHWRAATCGCDTEHADYEKHVYSQSDVTEPTCTAQGFTTYTCTCGYSYDDDFVAATSHNVLNWAEGASSLLDATGCEYTVSYSGTCESCKETVTKTELVVKHTFVTRVITTATCVASGTKGTFCASEDCKYHVTPYGDTTTYTDTTAHVWVKNDTASTETVAVYTCSVGSCGATKKVATGNSADLKGDELADTSEVELPDATIGLDEGIKNTFKDQDVSISAGTLTDQQKAQAIVDAGLSDEQTALLGDGTVYSFTLSTDKDEHDLGGTATIRIPYTLQAGDDPDCIVVWYIENGKLTNVNATYAEDADGNGYVTFTTTHFSYYTVTRLTAAQLCAMRGHRAHVIAPTCTEDGYSICLRCGEVIEDTTVPATGHTIGTEVVTAPTCSANGLTRHSCVNCDFTFEATTAAIGHYYVLSAQVTASCTAVGAETYTCAHCGASYTLTSPKLGHTYHVSVVAPTCESGGYTEKTCTRCGEVAQTNFVSPVGHTAGSVWYASADSHYRVCSTCGETLNEAAHVPGAEATEHSAQICTVCAYTLAAPLTHKHVLTKVEAVEPTCTTGGSIAYYVCACGTWFLDDRATAPITDHMSVLLNAKGHTTQSIPATEPTCEAVGYTAGVYCTACEIYLRGHVEVSAYGHDYHTVTKAPTCETAGSITYLCAWCGDDKDGETQSIAPLGHDRKATITAPTCTKEGYTTLTCTRCGDTETTDATPALGHTYASAYVATADGHRHACLRCDATTELVAHTPDYAEATEAHGIACIYCNYVITPAINHTHRPAKTVAAVEPTCTTGGTVAYYVCSCGEWYYDEACTTVIYNHSSVLVGALGHATVYVGATPATCEQIGYTAGIFCSRCETYINGHTEIAKTAHTFLGAYGTATKDTHTRACVVCGTDSEPLPHTYTSIVTAPTCTADGYTTFTCACGYSYKGATVKALGHAFGDWVSNGDGTHTHVCQNDKAHTETADCTFTSVVTEPTCTENGYTTHTCACGYSYVSDYVTGAHDYTMTTVAPTCTTVGYDRYVCGICGASLTMNEVAALGHSYENGVCTVCGTTENANVQYIFVQEITTPDGSLYGTAVYEFYKDGTGHAVMTAATATQEISFFWNEANGSVYIYLTEEDEYFAARLTVGETNILSLYECQGAHDYQLIAQEAPTCTAYGSETYRCTECGAGYGQSVPPLGHKYNDGVVTTAPGCESEGVMTFTCSVCGDSYTEAIEADGHSYETVVTAPTCTKDGYTTYTCSACGNSYVADKVAADGHDYGEDGTCTRCGEKEPVESNVAYIYEQDVLDENGKIMYSLVYTFYKNGTCVIAISSGEEQPLYWANVDGYICMYMDEAHTQMVGRMIVNEDGSLTPFVCTEHDYVVIEHQEATCTQGGFTGYQCTICGAGYAMGTEPLGHDYGEDGTCTRCGETQSGEVKEILYTFLMRVSESLDENGKLIAYLEYEYFFYADSTVEGITRYIVIDGETKEESLFAEWTTDGQYIDITYEGETNRLFIINADGSLSQYNGDNEDEDIDAVRNEILTKMDEAWMLLQEQYGDLSVYAEEFDFYYEEVKQATSTDYILGYYEKFQIFVDNIHSELGGEGEEIETIRKEILNKMDETWNELYKKYGDVSQYSEAYKIYYEDVCSAGSLEAINRYYEKFLSLVDDIHRDHSSETNDYIQGVSHDIITSVAVGTDIETFLASSVIGKTLYVDCSLSGRHEITITQDMLSYADLDLSVIGTTYLSLNYSLEGIGNSSMGIRISVTPDLTDAKAYGPYVFDESFADMTGWTDITVYDNGYFAIDGEFMTYTSFEDGVLVFDS
ncbi:MAG: hypothetical protein IJW83_03860, partial [Clostridia bacterium]|nr:hypothetical protein [Clostridia bacterium]